MRERIVYQNQDGGISIITPSLECGLSLEEIARKDVPAGVPYKIVDVDDIPIDRSYRKAWEINIDTPDGHGIGHEAWFAEQENKT